MILRLDSSDFAVRLPWFYGAADFARSGPGRVWNLEANALTCCPPGAYDVRFFLTVPRPFLRVSLDGETWQDLAAGPLPRDPVVGGRPAAPAPGAGAGRSNPAHSVGDAAGLRRAPEAGRISTDRLVAESAGSGSSQATGPACGGHADLCGVRITGFRFSIWIERDPAEDAPPVWTVLLAPAGTPLPAAPQAVPPWRDYVRHTRVAERAILQDWARTWRLLNAVRFGRTELERMFLDLAYWTRSRQVLDPADRHVGAVYSEEAKYDFQDAAAAAVVFQHMFRRTGDAEWQERAVAAKEYAYRGQHADSANSLRYGGFPSMRSFETPDFARLQYPLPAVNGVATCIIGNLMVRLHEEGLPVTPQDLGRVRRIGDWILNNESAPGVFRHHEGDERGRNGRGDCQNSNALGAGVLCRLRRFLADHGESVPQSWPEATRRGVERMLLGQEAIGCWPYLFATIGRGQAYHEQSIPDHGMGLYHLLLVLDDPQYRADSRLLRALKRAARWYLCTSYLEPDADLLNLEYVRDATGLGFSSFTWCRFMAAASLLRMAEATGEHEPWRGLALKLMEYVNTRLWNRTDPAHAPVLPAGLPGLRRVTWIQAVEWDAVLLLEMMDRLP